ncbi:variable large family protein [Borrelia hispanica]|uniref:variable large family protein n=1 Tax=Borrelia hispanica TaxID=40835 RepID=UPI00056E84BE|nr:variable large family protein [Borrelia hispanica]
MMVVMGCNSGGVKDPEKVFLSDIANLGKGFLDVFVSFGDMITGTLGIKAETKKSEIGKYFSDIEKSMQTTKVKLNEILEKNGKYEKVKTIVEEFISGTVDKIAEGAKEAAGGVSGSGSESVGNAVKNQNASPSELQGVKSLVKGIKEIVEIVLKGKGDAGADVTKGDSKKDVGKLFTTTDANRADNAAAQAAAASIGAVSGADILQAIAKSKEDPQVDNTDGIEKAGDAAEIAVAKAVDNKKEIKDDAKKDAVIAGGIALRAMTKGNKFSIKNDADDAVIKTVNGAAASAVNKVLNTLTIAIRNTVNEGLKGISEALGEIKQGEGSEVKAKAN